MVSIDVLVAVHHPVRRRIVDRLVLDGPCQVGTLARDFGEAVGSISHHLRMLERVEVVERAPELATDARTSWWRIRNASISWSVDDFAERPADQHQARVAEKLNVEHQMAKLMAWKRREPHFDETWRRAAFSSDTLTKATAGELEDLLARLRGTIDDWKAGLDAGLDDGDVAEREPVFVFMHGFPTVP